MRSRQRYREATAALLSAAVPLFLLAGCSPSDSASPRRLEGELQPDPTYRVRRLNGGEPVITKAMFDAAGATAREGLNINGPSVIRVPDWIARGDRAHPKAGYYMYFAHHRGHYIRLAWAGRPEGPWHLYGVGPTVEIGSRGVLDFGPKAGLALGNDITIHHHMASPDVHVDDQNQQIVLYFHSPMRYGSHAVGQRTFVATSPDGLSFAERIEPVAPGSAYFRVFEHRGQLLALESTARLRRADRNDRPWTPHPDHDFGDRLWGRECGPLFRDIFSATGISARIRHTAVRLEGDTLQIFFTRKGDTPERVLLSTAQIGADRCRLLEPSYPPEEILAARPGWEGGQFTPEPSREGPSPEDVNQLRDPYLFEDIDASLYLYYVGRGEDAIGLASLEKLSPTVAEERH